MVYVIQVLRNGTKAILLSPSISDWRSPNTVRSWICRLWCSQAMGWPATSRPCAVSTLTATVMYFS